MADIMNESCFKEFIRMADDGWHQGWHERNGGNLSYRLTQHELESVRKYFKKGDIWFPIGAHVPGLAGEYFIVTGSGRYFRNISINPEETVGIIEISKTGDDYRICWGLKNSGKPTSELPTHLMNHEIRKEISGGWDRVIYHAHPVNLIALTFLLPLDDAVFTRELWEMATECPIVFNEGVGVVPWMVPGGREIAVATSEKMKSYRAVIWAHHGCFCTGVNFDEAFGLMHTIEKSAEILMKVLSVSQKKRQTIQPEEFRALAKAFEVELPERFLREKGI